MKIQYLGDSKDSFKWDYHDYLTSTLGADRLLVVPMLTADDESGQGGSEPEGYPARLGILKFCTELRRSRTVQAISRLPEFSDSNYSVVLHRPAELFGDRAREEYFSGLGSSDNQVVFLDPDNGFEPLSRSDKHIGFDDIRRIATGLGDNSVVTVFHHFRRRRFKDDFAAIQERLAPLSSTAIYWHSLMFVAVSQSMAVVERVRRANVAYAENYPVTVVGMERREPNRPELKPRAAQRSSIRQCSCGCGTETKSHFAPGHDQKLRAALERACGGLLQLRDLVVREFGAEVVERELRRGK